MHGKNPLLRHEVVHDREDALLHFSGILTAEDDEFPVFKIERDAGGGFDPFNSGIGGGLSGVRRQAVGENLRACFPREGTSRCGGRCHRTRGPADTARVPMRI